VSSPGCGSRAEEYGVVVVTDGRAGGMVVERAVRSGAVCDVPSLYLHEEWVVLVFEDCVGPSEAILLFTGERVPALRS
jgi:hypothetical protein